MAIHERPSPTERAFYEIIAEKSDMLEGSFVSYESMKLDAGESLSVRLATIL